MRCNTRDSRWVNLGAEHSRSGRRQPGKTVASRTLQSDSGKDKLEQLQGRSNNATPDDQPTSPVLQAAIHNASDLEMLPVTYARLPSVRSWSSFRFDTANDEAISPRTVVPKDVRYQSEVSPLEHDGTATQDSPVSPDQFAHPSSEDRKESNVTIFPGVGAMIKKPEAKGKEARSVQSPANLAGFFRAAKEIYTVGPQGEGQKLWSSYTGSRKGKLAHIELEQNLPEHMPTTRRPSAPGLSDHPPTGALPPDKQSHATQRVPLIETLYPRKDSDVSRTSFEVPIRIDHGSQQYVDRSKSLPPAPMLQPAPKRKPQAYADIELKPLPLTPRTHSIAKSNSQMNSDASPQIPSIPRRPEGKSWHATKAAKASAPSELVYNVATYTQYAQKRKQPVPSAKDKPPNTKVSHWWKHLAELTSEDYIPPSISSNKPPLDPLKPIISRPRPITALQEGRTVNLSPSCGGVGGPGAVTPSHFSPRQKGKQKAISRPSSPLGTGTHALKQKNWVEKLTSPLDSARLSSDGRGGVRKSKSKRRDSDLSFMCAGVEGDSGAYVRDPGPSRQMQRQGEVSHGGRRDTGFYGAYHEVLEEYER